MCEVVLRANRKGRTTIRMMENGALMSENKVDLSNAALPGEEVKRIFMGGVGAGVTAADVEKTFSSLGMVHAVEFVRSSGRNFAFMDFKPSSDKSVAKLFSTYNGCTWKGGKLKLEIAKEHYFARLKREWAEDNKLASAPPPTKEKLEFVRSHSSSQQNSQIRIFFPNLRKVKPLPFKGTGKHKYSFQRIEVPPLPIHFCDCEEHSKALETTSQKYLSPLSTVVHEKERNIMANVINKLIGSDKDEIPSDRKTQVASASNISSPHNDDIHSMEAEVSDADDENFVMNIGIGADDDILMQLRSGMTQLTGQECGFDNPQSFKDRLVQSKADNGKRKKSEVTKTSFIKPEKRVRSVLTDGLSKPKVDITHKLSSNLSAAESVSSLPLINSEGIVHAPKILAETPNTVRQASPNICNAQPVDGQSWLQKSSWKDLVGGRESSSFSISNVLSSLASESPEMSKANNASESIAPNKPKLFKETSKQKAPQNLPSTPKIMAEAPNTERQNSPNMSNAQPLEGQSWLQKSSWKDLVGGRSSSSFSISNVISGSEMPEANASNTIVTKVSEDLGEKSIQITPLNEQVFPGINPKVPIRTEALEKDCKESSSSVQGGPTEGQINGVQEQSKARPDFNFGQVCPFMRNAESEQQWSMAKSALSGYLKRNSNEGNASKLSKGKPPSRR